jgi:prevent-host-death family protein
LAVDTVGLRELRQNASELVRRAEEGEVLLVTVAGRPAAVLGPATPARWRRYDEIAEIFAGPADTRWSADRDLIDQSIGDAWQR